MIQRTLSRSVIVADCTICSSLYSYVFFFFNDTATTEIYTLSLHDALPISRRCPWCATNHGSRCSRVRRRDRKSTRLNSSHSQISYAVFCLKKKKNSNPVSSRSNYYSIVISFFGTPL